MDQFLKKHKLSTLAQDEIDTKTKIVKKKSQASSTHEHGRGSP